MGTAYLSLGSNIDARANLASALAALRARFGEIAVSGTYRFPAVGFEGADFLNAAAMVQTDLDVHALDAWLHALEDAHGRDRSGPRHGDRPLDIDIVYYDDRVLDGPGHLRIPRPELAHAFVLMPLAEIAPGFVDPVTGERLADRWARHADHGIAFERIDLDAA